MARFRVFYIERQPKDGGGRIDLRAAGARPGSYFKETDWEEQVEAPNAKAALDSFFREHAGHAEGVMIIEEDGRGHPVEGIDYDPDRTYVWVEDGKLMEYQGMAEATAGAISCPLCDGSGEVDEEIAQEFSSIWHSNEYVEEES
ncbi:MAG: hypothetical protein JRJ80_19980 [Deltaproteobacteria bacterium]|nr:hypothetical protein [Deltaproteobacteria bacterium]RLC57854.1 MAG: hypothetical protein DRI30_03560 [Chloroflexota bacterium]